MMSRQTRRRRLQWLAIKVKFGRKERTVLSVVTKLQVATHYTVSEKYYLFTYLLTYLQITDMPSVGEQQLTGRLEELY